jgi:hypothetical protein
MEILRVLGATGILVAIGLVHGSWTDRWAASSAVVRAAAGRLERLPWTIGDWEGRVGTLDRRELERTGAAGILSRRYVHEATGDRVTVLLMCGRPGPMSIHTPEVCYTGAGYQACAGPVRRLVPRGDAAGPSAGVDQFWVADFQVPDALIPERIRVLYAWSRGSGWSAPENPRLALASARILYKLYVVSELGPGEGGEGHRPADEFLGRLLPALETVVASPPAPDRRG